MAPCTTNRTPRREAISEGVSARGRFRTADVGSPSTPDRLPRSDTSASANPRHRPWSSVAFSGSNSGRTAMEDRSPHSLLSFRTSLRTELRSESESGYFASITRTGPTNRYPFPTTVSRNRGRSALSPSAVRSFRTTLLTVFSVSTNRSERHSCIAKLPATRDHAPSTILKGETYETKAVHHSVNPCDGVLRRPVLHHRRTSWRSRQKRVHPGHSSVGSATAFHRPGGTGSRHRGQSGRVHRGLHRASENAGRLSHRSPLASAARKRHGHLWNLQGWDGRHIRQRQDGDLPCRELRLSRSRHAPLRDGLRRSDHPDSRRRTDAVQLHPSRRRPGQEVNSSGFKSIWRKPWLWIRKS